MIIKIENLKCGGCANTIKKNLLAINGVTDVTIDVEASEVCFSGNDDILYIVKNELKRLGYPERGTENSIKHKAKSYVSCAVGRLSKETN